MSVTVTNCQFCGQSHGLRCPEVKAVEYNPDGTVKRVEYLTPADQFYPVALPNTGPSQPPVFDGPCVPWGQAPSPRFLSAFTMAQVK